jgi:serine/threonine protein kinase
MAEKPGCLSAEVLRRYVSGRLDSEESSVVDVHLDSCPNCAATLANFDSDEDTLVSQLSGRVVEKGTLDRQLLHALGNIKGYADDQSLTLFDSRRLRAVLPVPTALRDYRLLEKLGDGGMGDVYKAVHVRLDKVVAIKVLHSEHLHEASANARFEREIRAAGKLEHPNIVRATDAGEAEGRHYLVMEYLHGLNLAELVRRLGQLPVADACEIIRQAANGLEHVHHHGLVHRDIKPSNLMLVDTSASAHSSQANIFSAGNVKVLDLGLALLNEAGRAPKSELTHSGMIIGTLDYMAPEQGNDTHNVDIRADIYSLGATLCKLLTAEAPFSGGGYDRPLRKLTAIATEGPPNLTERRRDIPLELSTIVARMLAKSPDDRYSTPAEVAQALEPFARGSNVQALLDRAVDAIHSTQSRDLRAGETSLSSSA